TSAENLRNGAYVLAGGERPQVLLIATGSEVALAVKAFKQLRSEGISSRVVSMPSFELFEQQPREYRQTVLPESITARVGIEAGVRLGWERYLGTNGEFIGMSTFGASGPADAVFERYGFTVENVVKAARRVMS